MDKERDRLIFDLLNQRQSQELDLYSNLDNKASGIASSVGVILGFIIGIQALISQHGLNPLIIVTFETSTTSLFIALLFSLVSLRVRKLELVPNAKTLVEDYASATMDEIVSSVGSGMFVVVQSFHNRNIAKAKFIQTAWILMAFGLVAMLLYAVAVIHSVV